MIIYRDRSQRAMFRIKKHGQQSKINQPPIATLTGSSCPAPNASNELAKDRSPL